MQLLRRVLPAVTLAALVVTFVPGLCAADCTALMDCCRKAPAPETRLDSASCCKAGATQVTVPSAMAAALASKIASDASAPAPFLYVDGAAAANTGFEPPATDQPPPHRAAGVPLYLLNTAVLR